MSAPTPKMPRIGDIVLRYRNTITGDQYAALPAVVTKVHENDPELALDLFVFSNEAGSNRIEPSVSHRGDDPNAHGWDWRPE